MGCLKCVFVFLDSSPENQCKWSRQNCRLHYIVGVCVIAWSSRECVGHPAELVEWYRCEECMLLLCAAWLVEQSEDSGVMNVPRPLLKPSQMCDSFQRATRAATLRSTCPRCFGMVRDNGGSYLWLLCEVFCLDVCPKCIGVPTAAHIYTSLSLFVSLFLSPSHMLTQYSVSPVAKSFPFIRVAREFSSWF